jgi:hypothetical protein
VSTSFDARVHARALRRSDPINAGATRSCWFLKEPVEGA